MFKTVLYTKGYLRGVAPKFALKFSFNERLTAGKYAYPGPRRTLEKASPRLLPFLQYNKYTANLNHQNQVHLLFFLTNSGQKSITMFILSCFNNYSIEF